MKENIIGVLAVIGVILGGWSLWSTGGLHSNGSSVFGATAAGNLLAENYMPYVLYNGGYNSAKDISTTANIYGAAATLSSTLTVGGIVQFDAGRLDSYPNATTTMTAAETLVPADIANYTTVVLSPNVAGNTTLTFFASSSATTWLPTAGDTQHVCFFNATTTAAVNYIFAGGTGTTLLVASSSATALGSKVVGPQKMGCFDFVRGNTSATTFDLVGAFTSYL